MTARPCIALFGASVGLPPVGYARVRAVPLERVPYARIQIGDRFGKLVVQRRASAEERGARIGSYFVCECDCGNVATKHGGNLRNGFVESCGFYCTAKEHR